ncbi:hypothetical protein M406DRAFT_107916 [Cryphonectria parasitica EP155]|uniref:Mid2 domain-containing protein n=1 Tax=Cryphonectria parasitica (strain ATCC 38755 / EP155) TaxID=660469 RepID=A0A9P4XXB7_CRYP1|nr:uncharacterized protein M406DRAFT_107916 [Cryphonectria parasitica EP155]KAF3762490.1 hypothetical protein M406DRAFT_107916 [Cryphonectria parasitica EP155]
MRIASQAAWALLPVLLASAENDDGNDAGLEFDWNVFTGWNFEVSDYHGGTISSSIVNFSKAADPTASIDFKWTVSDRSDFTFANAILVGGDKMVAEGYQADSNGQPPASATVPTFPDTSSLTLNGTLIEKLVSDYDVALFFQVGWKDSSGADDYGFSPYWAIAENQDEANSLFNNWMSASTSLVITSATAALPQQTTAFIPVSTSGAPTPTVSGEGTSSPSATAVMSSSPTSTLPPNADNDSSSNSSDGGHHYGSLSIGAIVGIAIGGAVFLILIFAIAAWLCLRARRRQRDGVMVVRRGEAQDMLAEKDTHSTTMMMEPDTPYSEDARSHRLLDRGGAGMSRLNGSSASMSITGEAAGARAAGRGRSLSSTRRGSAAYSSLRGPVPPIGTTASMGGSAAGGDSPTHTHPGSSSSPVGSPIGRSSTQQERAAASFGRTMSHKNSASNLSNVINADHNARDLEPPSAISADSVHENLGGGGSAPGSRTGTPQFGPTRFGGRSDTPGGVSISDQYAHLVEDGMTEDEIRRLEEEERALDEAIEQHRTESRAAG